MIRVVFLFLILSAIAYLGIKATEKMTGKQFIQLTKILGYVIISASLAMLAMFILVILF